MAKAALIPPRRAKSAAPLRPIRVMLSSRCNDAFPTGSTANLTDARRRLKDVLEAETLMGRRLFEVWINEDSPSVGSQVSWDKCMDEVDRCDILLVLYNGNAGWAVGDGDVGICHGEYLRGVTEAPAKTFLIQVGSPSDVSSFTSLRDKRFQALIDQLGSFRASVITVDRLIEEVRTTVLHAVSELVGLGVRDARRGRYHLGAALEWTKLDFRARGAAICDVIEGAMVDNGGTRLADRRIVLQVAGVKLYFCVHAIPGVTGPGPAREMVGRPFLLDALELPRLGKAAGPLHIIGCNRTVTETQATALLGFPDAIFVRGPFGVYVADDVQKIQFVMLENCRDRSLTRAALQRFTGWLDESGEGRLLASRAASRARIVKAIAAEAT